jgi:RNase adapter protein RapZ
MLRQLIIITGLSGSGKSIALRALEDSGYYCIDNLPATMLPQISQHLSIKNHELVAISIDSRSAAIETLPANIETLKSENIPVHVLYLESNTETLVKRFSETRRKHPLSTDLTTLKESIQIERELLSNLSTLGHVIDTSYINANKLRNWVKELVTIHTTGPMLLFTSFGFKHGIPLDADYVFDVRCLPNPHYDPFLRPFSGKDEPIKTFLQGHDLVDEMINDIKHYLEKWLPRFIDDNRSYFTVGIGCTGGKHRSVYIAETLANYFKRSHKVITRHRDLDEFHVETK